MEEKNNGGSAFPANVNIAHDQQWSHIEGMSLRDYFAAKAMQGMCVKGFIPDRDRDGNLLEVDWSVDGYAKEAYRIADAMLKAREK